MRQKLRKSAYLQRLRDGRIAVALQRPWADGTTHLVFTPAELHPLKANP